MKKKIHVLAVVDTPRFLEAMLGELRRAGLSFEARRVETQDEFIAELMCRRPEVILSNQGLPAFSGAMAHAAAKEKCPEVPFIFVQTSHTQVLANPTVSATAAEDLPRRTLPRLGPIVRRAVRQARFQAKLRDCVLEVLTSRWTRPCVGVRGNSLRSGLR